MNKRQLIRDAYTRFMCADSPNLADFIYLAQERIITGCGAKGKYFRLYITHKLERELIEKNRERRARKVNLAFPMS
jgi:hypothetical protein